MDNSTINTVGSIEKIVLIAGLTGVGLRQVYKWLASNPGDMGLDRGCVVHFEDVLMEGMDGAGCIGIDQVAGIIPISRDAGRALYESTVDRIIARLSSRGCRKAIVFIHLSYMVRGGIIANPALGKLLRAVDNIDVVYLVDDFYDSLDRIRASLEPRIARLDGEQALGLAGSPFTLDPLEYIAWREADYNLLTTLETFKPGLKAYILGVKHPPETFKRLLASLLHGGDYVYSYLSHPISVPRKLYSLRYFHSIRGNPIVLVLEAFKRAMIECRKDLILFEPTTVDELLADPARRFLGMLPKICRSPYGTLDQGDESECISVVSSMLGIDKTQVADMLDEHNISISHQILVDSSNRWPLHRETLLEEASRAGGPGYRYPHRAGGHLNILDAGFTIIYGSSGYDMLRSFTSIEIVGKVKDALAQALRDKDKQGKHYTVRVLEKLASHVDRQIEIRDYHYVSQARSITVAMPVIIADGDTLKANSVDEETAEKAAGIYVVRSGGMEAEMHRAIALARPINVYMLPITLDELLSRAVNSRRGDLARLVIEDGGSFTKCHSLDGGGGASKSTIEAGLRRCVNGLNRLFKPTKTGVHYCMMPVILGVDLAMGRGLTGEYWVDLERLKNEYAASLPGGCGG